MDDADHHLLRFDESRTLYSRVVNLTYYSDTWRESTSSQIVLQLFDTDLGLISKVRIYVNLYVYIYVCKSCCYHIRDITNSSGCCYGNINSPN